MPSRLIYLPIESYGSRSTEYMSAAGGVYETCFKEAGIQFNSLRPWTHVQSIKQGAVVDYYQRSKWGFAQIQALIARISHGELNPKDDVIFFEDFWTPGFEMLPYAQSLKFGYDVRNHIPVYSFCHAQSTDPFDFTARMSEWMRPMELGWATYQRGVMCACKEMRSQWETGGLPHNKLNVCGLSFNAGVLRERYGVPENVHYESRSPSVVFSSRWDTEKNPLFFLALAEYFAQHRPGVEFRICTGLPRLTSNDPALLAAIEDYQSRYDNLVLLEGLSKKQYFEILRSSKVQFNCASQDFVSYTLLDAVLNGCAPLYPNILTFPDALNRSKQNLYEARFQSTSQVFLGDAIKKLNALLDAPVEDYSWVWKKYETSTQRKLASMGFILHQTVPFIQWLNGMTVEEVKGYFNLKY